MEYDRYIHLRQMIGEKNRVDLFRGFEEESLRINAIGAIQNYIQKGGSILHLAKKDKKIRPKDLNTISKLTRKQQNKMEFLLKKKNL